MKIIHQADQMRFVSQLNESVTNAQDQDGAVLTYRMINEKTIDFNYSYVPYSFRGKGIAKMLVDAGMQWAKEQGFEIRASCSYVARFL